MAVAQRGQSIRFIGARVFGIADADQRFFEQADDHRKHFDSWQPGQRQISSQSLPQLRQPFAEFDHAMKFSGIAHAAPLGVVTILLAFARIPSGRLQMASRVGTNPHIYIGRRYRQAADALQGRRLANHRTMRIYVGKPFTAAHACQSRQVVGDIDQAVGGRNFCGRQ